MIGRGGFFMHGFRTLGFIEYKMGNSTTGMTGGRRWESSAISGSSSARFSYPEPSRYRALIAKVAVVSSPSESWS